MAIPSFEENLEEARRVSEREGKAQRRSSLAPGLASFFSQLLGAGTPTQTFTSRIQPGGQFESLQQPIQTGGTVSERLGRLAGGRGFFDQPREGAEGTLLTREESLPFQLESLKQTGRVELVVKRAKEIGRNWKPNSFSQTVPQDIVDYFYLNTLRREPPTTPLSVAQFNSALAAAGVSNTEFYRDLGIELKIGEDITGQISEEAKGRIVEKQKKRTTLFKKEPTQVDEFFEGVK